MLSNESKRQKVGFGRIPQQKVRDCLLNSGGCIQKNRELAELNLASYQRSESILTKSDLGIIDLTLTATECSEGGDFIRLLKKRARVKRH